jgi:hypothetical protein
MFHVKQFGIENTNNLGNILGNKGGYINERKR